MRFANKLSILFLLIAHLAFAAPEKEDWKGAPAPELFTLSTMGGLSILDGETGFGWPASFGLKILNDGFIPDINDQVFFEIHLGPVFFPSTTALFFSNHLRWDFYKNEELAFYSLGGLAGTYAGAGLGNRRTFHFRFALGVLWEPFALFGFRAEVSHDFTGVGVVFHL